MLRKVRNPSIRDLKRPTVRFGSVQYGTVRRSSVCKGASSKQCNAILYYCNAIGPDQGLRISRHHAYACSSPAASHTHAHAHALKKLNWIFFASAFLESSLTRPVRSRTNTLPPTAYPDLWSSPSDFPTT